MTVVAKPRTSAFVLDSKKSKEFFATRENTADKAIARVKEHRAKAGIVETGRNGKKV